MFLALASMIFATELKNDGCECDGGEETVTFQEGFADLECWMSVFVPAASDYPFTPEYVDAFIGPNSEGTFIVSLHTVDTDNTPLATVASEAGSFDGAEDQLSRYSFAEAEMEVPEWTEGNVGVSFCFDGHSGTPTIANDDDGMDYPDRNFIQALGDSWRQSSQFGVKGDWIMRLQWGEVGDADTDSDSDTDTDSDSDTDTDTDADADLALYSVSPNHTVVGTAESITLVGGGFDAAARVLIGGLELSGATVASEELITGLAPTALPVGEHDVTVVNEDGTTALLAGGFTVEEAGLCGCSAGAGAAPAAVAAALIWGAGRRRRS